MENTDAVRLAGAMDGCGTDEAKVKQILEGADTEEKRRLLRKHFNNYASELKQWEGGGGKDRPPPGGHGTYKP